MGPRKKIKVHIPYPCQEKWNEMTPQERGRHCAACNKVVVDLTRMNDAEIFRAASAGSFCGRLKTSQLERDIYNRESRSVTLSKAAAGIALLTALSSEPAAQVQKKDTTHIMDSLKTLNEPEDSLHSGNTSISAQHDTITTDEAGALALDTTHMVESDPFVQGGFIMGEIAVVPQPRTVVLVDPQGKFVTGEVVIDDLSPVSGAGRIEINPPLYKAYTLHISAPGFKSVKRLIARNGDGSEIRIALQPG